MRRQLPTLEIAGTTFLVDVDNLGLIEQDRPANKISFMDMQVSDYGYRFSYDTGKKNMLVLSWHRKGDEIHVVDIPLMTMLDPEGMAMKYNKSVDEVRKMHDRDLKCDAALLKERLNGKLPEIDIAGETYTVDWRLRQLRLTEEPTIQLDFDRMDYTDRGTEYFCLYHKPSHELFQVNENITDLPKEVIGLIIPGELKLDPIAVARQYNIGFHGIINNYPISKNLKAEVVPITETPVLGFVQYNRQRYGMKPLELHPTAQEQQKEEKRPRPRQNNRPHH